jgi:hypothetical protein
LLGLRIHNGTFLHLSGDQKDEEAFADCVCIQVIDDAKSKRRAKKVSNITKKIIEAYEKKGTPE